MVMMKNKWILALVVLALIVGTVVFLWINRPEVSATSFTGMILSMDDSSAKISGSYNLVTREYDPVMENELKEITANFDSSTVIKKTLVYWPTGDQAKEAAREDGLIYASDLPQETKVVDISEFKRDAEQKSFKDVTVTSRKNVLNSHSFTADQVEYSITVWSSP